MKRWLAFALLALFALPALAADNATLITPCGTGCVTLRAKDVGLGVQSLMYILGDTSGNAIYGTAGTANANILTVQGIASMTALKVDGSGVTQPVSGTITANQGGTWTVQQGTPPWTIQGDSASGASNAGNPVKAGGVFNSTQPTVTTGQTVDAQSTARGGLIVATGVDAFTVGGTVTANAGSGTFTVGGTVTANAGSGTFTVGGTVTANQGGAPWSDNVIQWNGVALGSPSAYGTSPGAVNVLGVNAFVTNTVGVSGTVTANAGSGTFTVGGTVTANAGTGTFTTSDTNLVSQGSTTSGEKGPLVQGAVTTAAPTYTTGQTDPLSLTTAGALRVDGSAVTQPVSGTVTANAGSGTFTVGGTVTANQGGTWTVQQGTPPWTVSQATASNLNATVVGTGTFAVQAAQSGTWTTRVVGNAGGAMDAAGQNATSPANELLTACQFNTSPTTVTSGNITPVQCNNAGALNVAIVSGGGSGGTASSFGAAFPATGTAIGVKNGANMTNLTADGSNNLNVNCVVGCGASGFADLAAFTLGTSNINNIGGVYETSPAPVAAGQAAAVQITGNRALQVDRFDSAGQELGANLPGRNNVPIQINQAQQFTQYNKTIFPTPTDASGSMRTASVIYDGTDYADVVAGNKTVGPANGALVVVPSPRLSLQCPYVAAINQTASTQIATGQNGKFLHICGFGFVSGTAQNVSLVEGTGSTCGTGTTALVGGTSASVAAAANGGLWNMTDRITIPMQHAGDNLCVLQSSTGNVSGTLTYGVF